MFSVGDKVVHRVHGAGIITEEKEMQITETRHCYFVVDMLGSDSTLMVPTGKAEKRLRTISKMTALRRLLTDKLAEQPNPLPKDYKERTEQVNNRLKSGEIQEWIEVVRDLTHRGDQGYKSKVDQRLLERAMHLLATEFAMAQGIDPEKAEKHLASIVQRRHEFKSQRTDTPGWLQTLRQKVMMPFTRHETPVTADTG